MDKTWVFLDGESDEYISGLRLFIVRAQSISPVLGKIYCLCKECKNRWRHGLKDVENHILCVGMWNDYVNIPWTSHGEQLTIINEEATHPSSLQQVMPNHDMADMLQDAFGFHDHMTMHSSPEAVGAQNSNPSVDAQKFYKLLEDANIDLFIGARVKKLEFLLRLYNIKSSHSNSDGSFEETLDLLRDTFPKNTTLPKSFHKTKKLIKDIGLSYENIDACPNDCMLYWGKDHKQDQSCEHCGASRWIKKKNGNEDGGKPKLLRLYVIFHWLLDCSVYICLAILQMICLGTLKFGQKAGFFDTLPILQLRHIWMKSPEGPGNNIDVYLQPLVEELKMLWNEGVQTYDAFNKEMFRLRAAVLWTINDFPAYVMLSGYNIKGFKACPVCVEDRESVRLKNCKKLCFMGARRWLCDDHRYRGWKNNFNGKVERRPRPNGMTGSQCLRATRGLIIKFGRRKKKKGTRKRKRNDQTPPEEDIGNWRKRSIFFELPYWEHLLLQHNLDFMHIEKNVTDSVVGTLLGLQGKNKDGKNARNDMVLLNVKHALHPVTTEGNNDTIYPPASFNLSKDEKTMMCEVMADYRPPG
ncbi:hypothetical protein ACLB2K_060497 [Fragaria x ananassa]